MRFLRAFSRFTSATVIELPSPVCSAHGTQHTELAIGLNREPAFAQGARTWDID
jgi:hypothetical protein